MADQPLATGARNAARPGLCGLCGGQVGIGERVADVPGAGMAHAHCIAKVDTGRPAPPPLRELPEPPEPPHRARHRAGQHVRDRAEASQPPAGQPSASPPLPIPPPPAPRTKRNRGW